MDTEKPRLCFVSLYSYPLFNPDNHTPFGGSEVRVSLIAKELARRGNFDVSLVVWDHGQPPVEMRDGLRIYAWPGKYCSLPVAPPPTVGGEGGLRDKARKWLKNHLSKELRTSIHWVYGIPRAIYHFFVDNPLLMLGYIGKHPVRRANFALFDQINADIYLMHGNSETAAELAFYARKRCKKYVFLAGSDADYHPGYNEKPQERGIYGFGYLMVSTIQNASVHIVQNEGQASLLKDVYQRSANVIPNPVDLTVLHKKTTQNNEILWVGKSDWIKRPEICLELAQHFPHFNFKMIMSYSNQQIHHHATEIGEALPNVTISQYVPFSEIEAHFATTRLFINTSVLEGFPNTFLQAAKYGVPIVSLQVDPNGMLSRQNCGISCNGDQKKMIEAINSLMTDETLYRKLSHNCLVYIKTYHDKEKLIPQYETILRNVLETK